MSDKRLVPASVLVFPQFENLEQRLLLTTLNAGDFFIYHNSAGQNVRVSLSGDAGTSAELFAYDDQNPDQRFADPLTGAGPGYGLVDLVGLMNGDINDQVIWPDGSAIVNSTTNRWVEYTPFVAGTPVTVPPTVPGTPSVRGSRTEIYAIYLSNANENTVLTITELNSTQPIADLSALPFIETAYTDIRRFTGGNQIRLPYYTSATPPIAYVNPPANSGGVLVGGKCDPIPATGTPPTGGNNVAFSAVMFTDDSVVSVPHGVFPGGELNAGITIADSVTGDPCDMGAIVIGGTVAGSLSTGGNIDTLEMGFLWGRVDISKNLGEMILRQGGGASGPAYPMSDSYGFDSYITVGGHSGEIRVLGGTMYSLVGVSNDPTVDDPSNLIWEVETITPDYTPIPSAAWPALAWIDGITNDITNDTQGDAQFVSSATGNFYIFGEGGPDYYALPLFAGQTVVFDGVNDITTDPTDWLDPHLGGTASLYDSEGRLMDTLGIKNIKGTTQQLVMTFTAPAAGIYYLKVEAGLYTIKVTGGPAASLSAIHVEGDLNGSNHASNYPSIWVANSGTIGAIEVSGGDSGSVTHTEGFGVTAGSIIAYEAASLGGRILSDGNIGSVKTSGDFVGDVCAGYNNGQFNNNAFIQNVSTDSDLYGYIYASGSIGVISVGGNALTADIRSNYDGAGPASRVDLIDVAGNWGNVIPNVGGIRPPTLRHGPGGDFGFIHVGGTIYVSNNGWISQAVPTTYNSGEVVTLNDDGGGRLTVTPTITPVLDINGNPTYDPFTGQPIVNIPTYSFIYIGVDDATMPGGVGGVIANLTINGPATLSAAAVVQLNDFVVNVNATDYPNAATTIGGTGRVDIYNINATGLTSFSNKTAGNLVSGSFDSIGSITVAGDIGPRSGSLNEWLPGTTNAPNVGDTNTEPQYGWFAGKVNGLNITGELGSLKVAGSLGDLRVGGKIGSVVVNTDKKTASTAWDGVLGIIWSGERIDSINVGDGLADVGGAMVAKAGIFCTKSIGTVSIVGPRFVRNGVVFGELAGAIIAGSDDVLTLPNPTPPPPTIQVFANAIGSIVGTNGAVLTALVGAMDLDQFQPISQWRTISGTINSISMSGKGAKIENTEITASYIRSIVTSIDSNGIENVEITGNSAPPDSQYVIGQVLAGGVGLVNCNIHVIGGSLGWIKATAKTGVIASTIFAATDGMAGVSAHDITGTATDPTEFHMPGVIGSMTATGGIDNTNVFAGSIRSISVKEDFTDNNFALAGLMGGLTVGGSYVNSSVIVQGSSGANLAFIKAVGNISGTILSGSHIGQIVSSKGSISANITTLGSGALSDVELVQAAGDFTGLLNVGGTLKNLTVGNEIGLNPILNGGVAQLYQIYGGLTQLTVGKARGGSGDLYADFSIAGNVGNLTIPGTLYGRVSIGGTLGKAVIGGDLGGLLDIDADGTPEALRGMLRVYGGMTSLTMGNGSDINTDLVVGDSIGSIILKGGFIRGSVESRYGSIGLLQLTGGGIQGDITADSISKITVTNAGISGDITARNGAISNITMKGGTLDADITAENGTVDALTLTGVTTTAGRTISASAGINSVKVNKGSLLANLLSRRDITNVTVSGDLLGDVWADTGIGTIKVSGGIGGAGSPMTIRSGGSISSIAAARMTEALVSSARDIVKVAIKGMTDASNVAAGYDVGPDMAVGGGDDTVHSGSVGSFSTGKIQNSIVSAGTGPGVDGDFILAGDNEYADGTSVVAKMTVKGAYTGSSGVVADTWVDPKYKLSAPALGVTIIEETPVYTITDMTAPGVFGPLAGTTSLVTADGMTITLTGAGVASYDLASQTLTIEQSNTGSRLTIVGTSGTPVINIVGIDDSSLGALVVDANVTVASMTIDGYVGTLQVSAVEDGAVWELPGGVGSAAVAAPGNLDVTAGAIGSWTFVNTYDSGTFKADSVGTFAVVGDMNADLDFGFATTVSVTGSMDGTIASFGTLSTLNVGGVLSGDVNVYAGDLGRLVVTNGLTGTVNNGRQILVDAGGNDVLFGGGRTTSVVVSNGDFGGASDTSFRSSLGVGAFSVTRGAFTGLLAAEGGITGISVAGAMSGKAWSGRGISSAVFGGMNGGLLAASNDIGTVSIVGDMFASWIIAGFNPGDAGYDAANGGEAANLVIDAYVSNSAWKNVNNKDVVYGGDIGTVTITGAMTASTISAGVGPGLDGYCGTGDEFIGGDGSIGRVAVTGTISGSGNADEMYGVFAVSNWPVVTYMGGNVFSSNGNAVVNSYWNLLPGTLAVTSVASTGNSIIVSMNNLLDTSSLTTSSFSLVGSADNTFTVTDDMNGLVSYEFDSGTRTIVITLISGTWATQPVDKYFRLTLTDSLLSNRGDMLDGEYNGVSPSGDRLPGGDFVYTLTTLTASPTLITDVNVGVDELTMTFEFGQPMDTTQDPTITFPGLDPTNTIFGGSWSGDWDNDTTYTIHYSIWDADEDLTNVDVHISAANLLGYNQVADFVDVFSIDTLNPSVFFVLPSVATIADADVGVGTFTLTVLFDEDMDQTVTPTITFPAADPTGTLAFNAGLSGWTDAKTYVAAYDVSDINSSLPAVAVQVDGAMDLVGNVQNTYNLANDFVIDTLNPTVASVTPSPVIILDATVGTGTFTLTVVFPENMDQTVIPVITFPTENPSTTITPNAVPGVWTNATTYVARYNVADVNTTLANIDVRVAGARDAAGNNQLIASNFADVFNISTVTAMSFVSPSIATITDATAAAGTFSLKFVFPNNMNMTVIPTISFPVENPSATITQNVGTSGWLNNKTYVASYNVVDVEMDLANIDVRMTGATEAAGAVIAPVTFANVFSIDTLTPTVASVTPSVAMIRDSTVAVGSFTLTVVFNENMNQTVIPTINFPVEDPSSTITLNTGTSGWTSATTYVASYDVVDVGQVLADIDVEVVGAQDLAGNTQVTGNYADNFSIDTLHPAVSSLTPSVATIVDSTVGAGAFTLTIVFDANMNQTVIPTISFPVEDPSATITLNVGASGWINATTYVASYDVVDAGQSLANIDVQVAGAQDLVGTTQLPGNFADEFSIDTLNPTVSSVTPSFGMIADADAGTATFALTVVFDEDMDTTVIPVITFPVEDPSTTLTLNVGASGWLNATTYEAVYDVADVNTTLNNIDVLVKGTRDLAGNDQLVDGNFVDNFSIDTANPSMVNPPGHLTITDANIGTGTIGLMATFDEAMDTSIIPTISFPVENPSATITLNGGMSGWINASTYVAIYNVVDVGQVLLNIDVQVSGAMDLAGNTQIVANYVDELNINTLTTMTLPSVATITDADVGVGAFTLTFYFDKSMDMTVTPTITFPTENPTGTITPNVVPGSGWVDATTYVARYNVADINTILTNVDVRVTGAKDAAGNTLIGGTFSDLFSIDTTNPTITSITPSAATITDATVGTGTFTLTIVFGSDMNQALAPTITFPAENPSATIAPSLVAGVWIDARTYVASYDVIDVGQHMENIDVRVSAQNLVGNTSVVTTANVFSVETLNASVTPSLLTVTDAAVGAGTFQLTIAFTDAMDQTVTPVITLPASASSTLTFNPGASGWVPATNTYVATYDVSDANVPLSIMDVQVTNIADLIGSLTGGIFVGNFNIDTQNPTVSVMVPSVATIRNANVGTNTFHITLVFSENMDMSVAPIITFPVENPTATIGAPTAASHWVSATTYVAMYNVVDLNTILANIDVQVAGAKDAAGNILNVFTGTNRFSIDTLNP